MKSFFTTCQLKKPEIKSISNYELLLTLVKKKSITLRETILNNKAIQNLLQLPYVYQNIEAIQLKDISQTDFIIYQIKL